jgi:hypothetical protein
MRRPGVAGIGRYALPDRHAHFGERHHHAAIGNIVAGCHLAVADRRADEIAVAALSQ